MSYQSPGTPRFYIDTVQLLKNTGAAIEYSQNNISANTIEVCEKLFNNNLRPDDPVIFDCEEGNLLTNTLTFENDKIISKLKEGNCYFALLNHNLFTASEDVIFYPQFLKEDDSEYKPQALEGINAEVDLTSDNRGSFKVKKDGFSIGTFNCDETEVDRFYFGIGKSGYGGLDTLSKFYIGGVSFGKYYDMPNSPDLDLTMKIENDGYRSITTQGGKHINYVDYSGTPMWTHYIDRDGDVNDIIKLPAWAEPKRISPDFPNSVNRELVGMRRGRRVWSMNYKYFSEKNMFPSNFMSSNYMETSNGYDSSEYTENNNGINVFEHTINEHDSFISQVLNKLGNGEKFIFQPNKNNSNDDQFAICQINQKKINIKQEANGVYSISLEIREVW